MAVDEMDKAQRLSAEDLAEIVRAFREMRQWSQDTLAAISKLNIRTIQRVENAEPSSGDTRRALALAFELNDADIFNKPLKLPSPDEIQSEVENMRREYVTLYAHTASSGQELVRFFEQARMDCSSSAVELEGVAAEAFAALVDYLRDFRDSDVQTYLDALDKAGYSVSYARRDTKLVGENWADKTPWAVTIAYLMVYPKGSEPKVLLVPRKVNLGC
jgi:transcriptional regulator with XRE-family HTH domain